MIDVDTGYNYNHNDRKFSALEHLTGHYGVGQFKCLDLTKDVAFIGPRRKYDSYEYVKQKGGTVVGRFHSLYQDTNQIHDFIHRGLEQNMSSNTNDLWISCSLNVLDSNQFMSKQRNFSGSERGDGVPIDFVEEVIRSFADESIGLD